MRPSDLAELVLLAALWGGSFLFMRLGAPEFGAVALVAVRVALAAAALLPLVTLRGQMQVLRTQWRPIAVVGVVNSALPFLLFTYATLSITAGLSAVFNATAPLWGAVVAWLWLGDRPGASRSLGLAVGFAGVAWLAWDKASFKAGASDTGLAVIACLAATLCYGIGANYTKKRLTGVSPLAVAAGSQVAAAVALAVPAALWWPAAMPSLLSWGSVALLGVLCTGLAYLLYFRLIAHVGPSKAIAVTYLIPLFGVLWGGLFLGEQVTLVMVLAGLVILCGTALATGLVTPAFLHDKGMGTAPRRD
ncbi:MAG: DMT family transporter [Rubrivivax sp.]|nr:DMT family transporter [Rubrivivax sp.]